MINIIENLWDDNRNTNSQFFGNIMIRFFVTKKTDCKGKLLKSELFNQSTNLTSDKIKLNTACFSRNHYGDEIDKNFTIAGIYNYTDKYQITRSINSPIGSYDNTGWPIIFYKNK
jgi:hypothetical protein